METDKKTKSSLKVLLFSCNRRKYLLHRVYIGNGINLYVFTAHSLFYFKNKRSVKVLKEACVEIYVSAWRQIRKLKVVLKYYYFLVIGGVLVTYSRYSQSDLCYLQYLGGVDFRSKNHGQSKSADNRGADRGLTVYLISNLKKPKYECKEIALFITKNYYRECYPQ